MSSPDLGFSVMERVTLVVIGGFIACGLILAGFGLAALAKWVLT